MDKKIIKKEKSERDFTEGSIIKQLIFLTIPIIIGNLLQSAYQLTDAFWVGRIGANAVAAVTLSFPIVFFIIALSGGIGLAGAVFVSQYKGKENYEMVDKVTAQALIMAFFDSVFFSIIGYVYTPEIVNFYGAEPEVFQGAVSYLRMTFFGLFFIFGYLVFQSISRAVGDAKTPVYIVLGTVLLNFLLDPLFIFGWKFIPAFGVAGAALATLMTQLVALVIGIAVLFKGYSGIHLKLSYFKFDFGLMKKMILLGIPLSIEQSSRAVGAFLMTALVASFGTIILAAYGVGNQIFGIFILVSLAISIANSTIIGHNLGAGKIERAAKVARTSAFFSFFVMTIIAFIAFIFAPKLIALFVPNDVNVINSGAWFLRAFCFAMGLIGVQMAFFGALRGSGSAKTTMSLSIISVFLQIGIAFLLSKYTPLNEYGIWLAFPISIFISFIITLLVFMKGDWKNKKLIETPKIQKEIKEECLEDECRVSV